MTTTNTYVGREDAAEKIKLDYFRLSSKLLKKPPVEYLGKFAQLVEEDGTVVVEVSDGTNPIGPIEEVNFHGSGYAVGIRLYRSRFRTVHFDHDRTYPVGATLFVNKNGLVTTERTEASPSIGIVIENGASLYKRCRALQENIGIWLTAG